jgi:hypothetical protein
MTRECVHFWKNVRRCLLESSFKFRFQVADATLNLELET